MKFATTEKEISITDIIMCINVIIYIYDYIVKGTIVTHPFWWLGIIIPIYVPIRIYCIRKLYNKEDDS